MAKPKKKEKQPKAEVTEFELGVNLASRLEGSKLTIEIDLAKDFGLSNKKGRSYRVASTLGNKLIPGADPAIKIGLNCFKLIPEHLRKPVVDKDEE